MANLYDGRWRASDANGNAYVGALLYIYDAGTSNLSSVWSDTALTVAAANPLVSDANGFFPQFYVAEGSLFDAKPKTSGGVSLSRDSLSIAGVGSQTGAFTRDFTSSRAAIRNSGGVVQWESGDASPDNIGGTSRDGGWNGTQGDTKTIDYALVNTTGRLKEQGYKFPGIVRSEAVTFSGAASVAIPLTNDPTGVRAFEIDIIDLQSSNTGTQNWGLTFSYDGGGTYAASGYIYQINWAYATTNGATGGTGPSGLIVTGTYGTTNLAAAVRLSIITPNSGNNATLAMGQAVSQNFVGTTTMTSNFSVAAPASSGRATHVKLTSSAGNLSGVYRVVPMRGLGET